MTRVLIVLGCLFATAATAGPYAAETRTGHLAKALAALTALGDDGRRALELELHEAVRTTCRPTARPATTACMIEVARAVCRTRPQAAACLAASDIVMTNQHAEADLVPEATRIKLVRSSSDYHAAVTAELWSRYAILAAELALAAPGKIADVPARIDRFCTERDRISRRCDPLARGCVPSLAWQRCAAGLVWFLAHAGDQP